jgi:hypothetical protein
LALELRPELDLRNVVFLHHGELVAHSRRRERARDDEHDERERGDTYDGDQLGSKRETHGAA